MRTETSTGAPAWRRLAGLAALVALVHALVLSASPAQLGTSANPDTAGSKVFVVRSIETAPSVAAQAPPPVAQVIARTARAKVTLQPQKNRLDATADQFIQSQPTAYLLPPELPPVLVDPAEPDTSQAASAATQAVLSATPPALAPAVAVATAPTDPKTTPVTDISLPGSARLQYKVVGLSKNLNYQANAELAWKTNGDSYEVMMKVSAFLLGSRSMTSVGKITGGGLAPTRFADKFRTELAAHFQADKGKITFSANTPDAPWVEGAQDRVSVFLQLGGLLAAKPGDFPAGSSITLFTVGPRDADTWTFVVESEETLSLPSGDMATLKVTRKPRREFDQKVEVWYAPALGYLPVRNRITQENGDFVDQQLTGVSKL